MRMPSSIDIADIVVPDGRRPVDGERVNALAASIRQIGVKHPVTVRYVDEMVIDGRSCIGVPVLVAGGHRLAAIRALAAEDPARWAEIPVSWFEGDDTDARLWEIAENLHRAELTVQERADQIAEWVRLTEEKNIGATCADIQRGRGQPKGGINAAVRDLGIDRTEAQRAVKIASITPEARAAADEAGLDTQKARLEIAKAAPEKQVEKVAEIQARRKPAPLADDPLNDLEALEQQVAGLMTAWNKAAPAAREEFLLRIDRPLADQCRATA